MHDEVQDGRFIALLWRFLKAGHIDCRFLVASSEGVPQGGVLSPCLSNIMLHEFDAWLDAKYLNKKVRKDRWAWNFGIQQGSPAGGSREPAMETRRRLLTGLSFWNTGSFARKVEAGNTKFRRNV